MTASADAALSHVLIPGDRRTPFAGQIHHPDLSARLDCARRFVARPAHFVPSPDAWPHEPQAGNAAFAVTIPSSALLAQTSPSPGEDFACQYYQVIIGKQTIYQYYYGTFMD
jgi:hypothetical protein